MSPLRRVLPGVLTLWWAIAAGCALKEVSSFTARGVDIRQYQTYRWADGDQPATGDSRLDNNQLFRAQVQRAIDRELAAHRFQQDASGAADLIVRYHAQAAQRLETTDRDWNGARQGSEPSLYEAGTLVIDLVDARTSTLVWRGWAQGSIDGAIDDQTWLDELVDRAVTRILERLPTRI